MGAEYLICSDLLPTLIVEFSKPMLAMDLRLGLVEAMEL